MTRQCLDFKGRMFYEKSSAECVSPLPAAKMPACWVQEDRMNALFSPFRSKSANPQDWASKYKFWQEIIYDWLSHTMNCSFSISDINDAFKRKGCRPLCLTTVVEELLRNNEIIPEHDFLQEPCESWTSWSINVFVRKPLVWSVSKLKSYVVSTGANTETKYIHLRFLNEVGKLILSILSEKKDNILIPLSDILKCYEEKTNKEIPENTAMYAIIWLKRTKKIAFKDGPNKHEFLIKMMMHATDTITEVEAGLYALQKQEEDLMKEIHKLEEDKINIINETKVFLVKGMRRVAKAHLRKKIEVENTIEKRSQALENLRSLISSIQNSHSNTSVLSAYKIGNNALKQLTQSGLSESNVRDVIDELSETIEDHKEIHAILSDTLKSDESDQDLEQELEELLKLDNKTATKTFNDTLNASIDELEQNLRNLSVEDTSMPITPSKNSEPSSTQKRKLLTQLELA